MKKILLAVMLAVGAGASAGVTDDCMAKHGTNKGPVYDACVIAMSCRMNCVNNDLVCKRNCCENAGYVNVNGLCDK